MTNELLTIYWFNQWRYSLRQAHNHRGSMKYAYLRKAVIAQAEYVMANALNLSLR